MKIDWNLINCALNKHRYREPIKDETLERLVKTCVFCNREVVISNDFKFKKLEEQKKNLS